MNPARPTGERGLMVWPLSCIKFNPLDLCSASTSPAYPAQCCFASVITRLPTYVSHTCPPSSHPPPPPTILLFTNFWYLFFSTQSCLFISATFGTNPIGSRRRPSEVRIFQFPSDESSVFAVRVVGETTNKYELSVYIYNANINKDKSIIIFRVVILFMATVLQNETTQIR